MRNLTKGLIAGSVALTMLWVGFVSHWEGRSLRAYQDIVGVWTICDGETKGVEEGDTATPAECDSMLARNLLVYEVGLDQCLTYPVPGEMKVALVSWTYNVGVGAACSSTLVRLANTGNLVAACDQLLRWTRAGGEVVAGLVNRRKAEHAMCLGALE